MKERETKAVRLDFELKAPTGVAMPDGMTLSHELIETLPSDWMTSDNGEFWISNIRWGFFQDERLDNLVEKNEEQQRIIDDQRHEIAGLEVALSNEQKRGVKSVGITEQEYETARSGILEAVSRFTNGRIEDMDAMIEELINESMDALNRLPVLEERDLGWGDDDDLQALEDVQHDIARATAFMKGALDDIRTGRGDTGA